MSEPPTCGCGLPMSRNPHPDAGDPTYDAVEVGYLWECIPCLVKTRNRVGRQMRKAQAEVEQLHRFVGEIRTALRPYNGTCYLDMEGRSGSEALAEVCDVMATFDKDRESEV